MTRISKKIRNTFREFLVNYYSLATIDLLFDSENFEPDDDFVPSIRGERRSRVEQYYANIHFDDPDHIKRLIKVYQEVLYLCQTNDEVSLDELEREYQNLVRVLEADGFKIFEDRIVYEEQISASLIDDLREGGLPALYEHIERIRKAVDSDPSQVIGSSKELIESTCKVILDERNQSYSDAIKFPELVKQARSVLQLLPENISNEAKGAKSVKQLLSNLSSISESMMELRKFYGTGHGRQNSTKERFSPRHARLAAHSAITVACFLFETHRETMTP